MKNKTCIIILLISSFLLQNCLSFRNNLTNGNPLNKSNLLNINGQYEVLNLNSDSISKQYGTNNNFLIEIDRKLITYTLKIDESKVYSFEMYT